MPDLPSELEVELAQLDPETRRVVEGIRRDSQPRLSSTIWGGAFCLVGMMVAECASVDPLIPGAIGFLVGFVFALAVSHDPEPHHPRA